MEWFRRHSVKPNHFESYDRTTTPLLVERLAYSWFRGSDCFHLSLFSIPVGMRSPQNDEARMSKHEGMTKSEW
jgi:hypothetical protein